MSNNDSPETTPQDAAGATQDAAGATQDAAQPEEVPQDLDATAGREAAKYRRQLRDVEAERDQLRESRDAARRGLIDYLLERDHGLKPAALWAAGTELDSLLTEEGSIDADKLTEAVNAARELFGIPRPGMKPDPSAGRSGEVRAPGIASAFL